MDLPPHPIWHSSDIYLFNNSTSLFYLLAFSLFSISCIVFATVSSRPCEVNDSSQTCRHLCPVSASPLEEVHAVPHFLHHQPSTHCENDIENQCHSQQSTKSPDSLRLPKLHHNLSEVTLTFGSDKPEVYMKMAQQAHNLTPICRCPCNHRSPELAMFPHISNASTISTDLSVPHHMDVQDSLSSIAVEPQNHPCVQLQDKTLKPAPKADVVNHIENIDKPPSAWIIINDEETNAIAEPCATTQVAIRNDLACRIAYTRMKTLVPFIDPAILIHWIALKIIVSIYVLAKGLYDHAVDSPVIRMFQE